jgi:hypothetical protein
MYTISLDITPPPPHRRHGTEYEQKKTLLCIRTTSSTMDRRRLICSNYKQDPCSGTMYCAYKPYILRAYMIVQCTVYTIMNCAQKSKETDIP